MATIPPPNEELPSHSVPCPSCGVPVAIGYPRCPKCKAAVPQGMRARRGSVREQLLAGGTSTEPEAVGSSSSWLPWVLVALVIVGIGAFVAFRDSGAKTSTTDSPGKVIDDDDDEDVDDVDDPGEAQDEGSAARERAEPKVKAGDPMAEAETTLDDALRGQRLWATVTHDASSTLYIESAQCAEIEPQIDALAGGARAAGARKVECRAEHGQLMFTRGL